MGTKKDKKKLVTDPVERAWNELAQGAAKRPDYKEWVRQFDRDRTGRGRKK